MPQPKDPTRIPPGNHCDQWVTLAPGEVVPQAGPDTNLMPNVEMSRSEAPAQIPALPVALALRLPWEWTTGLLGPFAPQGGGDVKFPRLPRVRRRPEGDVTAVPTSPRMVRAAVPAFNQLRAAMSEVASHPWWRFDEARAPFWRAGKPLRFFDDRMQRPGHGPAQVLDILAWPEAAQQHPAGLALLGLFGRLLERVAALRQAALANGRWWPAPERIELVLVFEAWVGMRMRFPQGYQPPWANWITVWHPMPPREFAPPLPLPSRSLVESVAAMPRRSPAPAPEPFKTLEEAGLRVVSVAQQYPELAPTAPPLDLPALPGCVWLLQTHVAGLAYHQAAQAMDSLREGGLLLLRREPGNPHDALAIEVLTEAQLKLGYVPHNRNPVLARLMDAGQTLEARVVSVGRFPREPQAWQTAQPEVRLRIDWRPPVTAA